ncbi:copper transporter [Schaalia vaccimaxillae]|uniref:copper transporter n=1 Tax=Schaalia vaccimaxillae TaxID=183916 RepID=UPI000412E1ED|nr:copper transporter [Schaalia vaccimaxillae]
MINFRYHLVSLIAVFSALAIGIILGAGPLQTRLSSALEKSDDPAAQVDSPALADARARQNAEAAGLLAAAQAVIPGTLEGLKVVTVSLPGADSGDVSQTRQMLEDAGAQLVGAVSLTSNWDSQAMSKYRDTLATPLATHMVVDLPAQTTSDGVVGYSIVQVLTTTGSETKLVSDILTDKEHPILTFEEDPSGSAEALVLISARSTAAVQADEAQSGGTLRSVEAWSGLAKALNSAPKAGVLLVDAAVEESMGAKIRKLGVDVTTVDSPGTVLGSLGVVLALPQAGSEAKYYGVDLEAQAVLPEIR